MRGSSPILNLLLDMPNSKSAYRKEYYLKNREHLIQQSTERYWHDRDRRLFDMAVRNAERHG